MRVYCINAQLDCSNCNFGLQIDPYPANCPHGCIYCWSFDQQFIDQDLGSDLNYGILRSILRGEECNHPLNALLQQKVPIRFGHSTDPLPPIEREEKRTLKLIALLNEFMYPFIIVTKSDLVASPEYLDLITKGNGAVQISLISLDDELLNKIEPGASKASSRYNAIKALTNAGIHTSVRISPIIDGIDYNQLLVKLSKLHSINIIASAGELSERAVKSFKKIGQSVTPYFDKEQVEFTIDSVKEAAEQLGLNFNHCYLGNPLSHYRYNDSHHDCCNTFSAFSGETLSATKAKRTELFQINFRQSRLMALINGAQQYLLKVLFAGLK